MTIETPQGSWENWIPWNEVYKSAFTEAFPKWEYFVWSVFSLEELEENNPRREQLSASNFQCSQAAGWAMTQVSPIPFGAGRLAKRLEQAGISVCSCSQGAASSTPARANPRLTLAAGACLPQLDTPACCHWKEPPSFISQSLLPLGISSLQQHCQIAWKSSATSAQGV